MASNFLPTFLWFLVIACGAALVIEGVERREGVRQVIQVVLGALLILAFVANAWAGMSHWAYCEENPHEDQCEADEDNLR